MEKVTVKIFIKASIEKVWEFWTKPEHIPNWNFASDEWCCPAASNDLKPGGEFSWRMEAKDRSMGFDLTGTYETVIDKKHISYRMSDGRKVDIEFSQNGDEVMVVETFEPEGTNTDEQQRAGWQAILGNFKKYVESR